MDSLAFRKDLGTDGVHEGLEIEWHEVVLLDDDTLDLLDQALPFGQVDARLMFGP